MIVAFGTYDVARHPRIGIIIEGLRRHGHEVTELNRPLGFSTAERVRMLRQPWRLPRLAWRLIDRWMALWGQARVLRRTGITPAVVLVGYMGHFDVLLARRLFRGSTIVLDHLIFAGDTASDRGARGLRVRLLSFLDRRAIASADLVVVDTPEHAAMLPPGTGCVVVPVGARAEWFDAGDRASQRVESDPLSVVFFGLFTPLQGTPVIARALRRALADGADLRATVIGTGQDHAEARTQAGEDGRITWLDWVEPDRLPDVVASHDVCLGIFGPEGKALRVVPNKVYEGAAAGCAILTSDTPPQRSLLGDAAVFVPPGDAEALASVLCRWAEIPSAVDDAKAAAQERAQQFHPGQVVLPLLNALELA